jgi:hypothetical protein
MLANLEGPYKDAGGTNACRIAPSARTTFGPRPFLSPQMQDGIGDRSAERTRAYSYTARVRVAYQPTAKTPTASASRIARKVS